MGPKASTEAGPKARLGMARGAASEIGLALGTSVIALRWLDCCTTQMSGKYVPAVVKIPC